MRELELDHPYTVPYKRICAVCDPYNEVAEIIEYTNCYGGAAWAKYHYSHSPLILDIRVIGNTIRYLVKAGYSNLELKPSTSAAGIESVIINGDHVSITYAGLGGGGVGATMCRACAEGVISYDVTESGGSRSAKGTISVPRMERVIIGIDDTDTKYEGATWTLCHNIANSLDSADKTYLSQALVQLFPVPEKTQNCVSTVIEFGCTNNNAKETLLQEFKKALLKYSVSNETGMVAITSFDPVDTYEYSKICRSQKVTRDFALEYAKQNNIEVLLDGNGVIGALAALAWVARPDESIIMEAEI
ncbi:methanogenesis marker protein 11 [Methanosalsum zhilinae DSM 4017]|uniref:Methanogenesis marker protein 11 n=1 Tax=Methanosalsum zhilinae (strain DSM 4017 / NBRC 107636 / OCM 62 / WeN5) TaxID=679901 RepID=F7XLN4_METZD|nr:methanogenesis marker protein 11 [Methanosalsum zhilinae]AEH60857.1 methanogenesis marker protein 11 [Methanosalsum zhilinae DSM 4017]